MRRRKRGEPHANHERWLVSYADFITLLFAFFVVMYSTAQVDKQKVGKLALSIQVAFHELGVFPGADTPSSTSGTMLTVTGPVSTTPPPLVGMEDLIPLQHELQQSLHNEILHKAVAIRSIPDGLVISLSEVGFFDSGSATIQVQSRAAFGRIATLLLRYPHRIRIEGHTDNTPIHNSFFASNWELSTERAVQLVELLVDKYQFPPQRLSAAGFAEYHPVTSNDTKEGRAQNRRVDIVVLGRVVAMQGLGSSGKTESQSVKPNPSSE